MQWIIKIGRSVIFSFFVYSYGFLIFTKNRQPNILKTMLPLSLKHDL
jgi:hypothetical protein